MFTFVITWVSKQTKIVKLYWWSQTVCKCDCLHSSYGSIGKYFVCKNIWGLFVLGAWLCLNSMGHHVWKVIRSKSVFTRVTDGQRCCYYSVYVILATAIISGTATAAHFLIGDDEGYGENKVWNIFRFRWIATIFLPVNSANSGLHWKVIVQVGKVFFPRLKFSSLGSCGVCTFLVETGLSLAARKIFERLMH